MAEYAANDLQLINPGESAVFTTTIVPCNRGLVRHSDGTPNFLLSGWVPNASCCPCARNVSAEYLVDIGANISVPTGGTVGQISIAISVDGATVPYSEMDVTPAAVEEFFNVGRSITVPIFNGCCQTVTVRNISDQQIAMKNASIRLTRPDLLYSR